MLSPLEQKHRIGDRMLRRSIRLPSLVTSSPVARRFAHEAAVDDPLDLLGV